MATNADCMKTATNLVPQPSPFRAASFLIHTATQMHLMSIMPKGRLALSMKDLNSTVAAKKPDEPIDAYAAAIHGMAATRKVSGWTDELIREKDRMWYLKE